jgi:23S rRNA (uracil1939-C5)-methyltransferase
MLSFHVETCALLSKLKSSSHIKVDLKLEEIDTTKAEKKATYQEIKDFVKDTTG